MGKVVVYTALSVCQVGIGEATGGERPARERLESKTR